MAAPTNDLVARFPALAEYIRQRLPNVRGKLSVWKPFLKWSELPESVAVHAVTYSAGRGPHVGITSRTGINGIWLPSQPNFIWLHERVAKASIDRRPGADVLVESTIMHELVHWGNFVARHALDGRKLVTRKDSSGRVRGGYTQSKGKLIEVGKRFEVDAYKVDVNLQNMGHVTTCGTCWS